MLSQQTQKEFQQPSCVIYYKRDLNGTHHSKELRPLLKGGGSAVSRQSSKISPDPKLADHSTYRSSLHDSTPAPNIEPKENAEQQTTKLATTNITNQTESESCTFTTKLDLDNTSPPFRIRIVTNENKCVTPTILFQQTKVKDAEVDATQSFPEFKTSIYSPPPPYEEFHTLPQDPMENLPDTIPTNENELDLYNDLPNIPDDRDTDQDPIESKDLVKVSSKEMPGVLDPISEAEKEGIVSVDGTVKGVGHLKLRQNVIQDNEKATSSLQNWGLDVVNRDLPSDVYQGMLEHSPDAVVFIDTEGVILRANFAFLKLFEYTTPESQKILYGSNIRIIIPPRFHTLHDEGMKRFMSTGQAKVVGLRQAVEVAAIKSGGEEFPIELSLSHAKSLAMGVVFIGFIRDISTRKRQEAKFAKEKEKTEKLLGHVLPPCVIERLKKGMFPIAERFEGVSVMFFDISGFTSMSSTMKSEEVVNMLNGLFVGCDGLMSESYPQLEKIKTIGDSLMVTTSTFQPLAVHFKSDSHQECIMNENRVQVIEKEREYRAASCASDLINYALDILALTKDCHKIRIGINTGTVNAALVGLNRFQADVFGDAVNTASRYESNGEPGRLHISPTTMQLVNKYFATDFVIESRGTFYAKGKGEVEGYFVTRAPGTIWAMKEATRILPYREVVHQWKSQSGMPSDLENAEQQLKSLFREQSSFHKLG